MRDEKFFEVVRASTAEPDVGVHAARTYRARQNIPNRDTMPDQLLAANVVLALNAEKLMHDRPEGILRVRVVLLFGNRALAR